LIGVFEIAVKTAFLDWEAAVLPLNYARKILMQFTFSFLDRLSTPAKSLTILYRSEPGSSAYSSLQHGVQTVYSRSGLRLESLLTGGRPEVVGAGQNEAIDPQPTYSSFMGQNRPLTRTHAQSNLPARTIV
jgi:hypothetical protein